MPESWDASPQKARELRPEHWGTPAEVTAMAVPVRTARNRREAVAILKEIALRGPFTSRAGLAARLQRRSVGKLASSVAVHASFSPEAHYQAAANIDRLFSNAIEPWFFDLNPNKNNEGIKARRYLFAPMEYQEQLVVIKITVKEFEEAENRLYSIEALDIT